MSEPHNLHESDYLNSDLVTDDYINVLAFLHYKYFDILDLFYTNSSHDTLYWLYIVLSCLDIVVEFHSFYVTLFFLKVFETKLQSLS